MALAAARGVCFVLFASGFVSLIGGLAAGRPGFDIADRTELEAVATVVRKIADQGTLRRFSDLQSSAPDGRPKSRAWLWRSSLDAGFRLRSDRAAAQRPHASARPIGGNGRALCRRVIIFWGREEKRAYASSPQPWRGKVAVVANGFWGTIYDLERPAPADGPIAAVALRVAAPDRSRIICSQRCFLRDDNRRLRAD